MIRSLLDTEGIESTRRKTDFAAGASDGGFSAIGPFEILVPRGDLDTARALVAAG